MTADLIDALHKLAHAIRYSERIDPPRYEVCLSAAAALSRQAPGVSAAVERQAHGDAAALSCQTAAESMLGHFDLNSEWPPKPSGGSPDLPIVDRHVSWLRQHCTCMPGGDQCIHCVSANIIERQAAALSRPTGESNVGR